MSSKWLLLLAFIAFLQLAVNAKPHHPHVSTPENDVINTTAESVSSTDSVTHDEHDNSTLMNVTESSDHHHAPNVDKRSSDYGHPESLSHPLAPETDSDYGRPRLPSRRPKHHVDPPAPETDSDYGRPRLPSRRPKHHVDPPAPETDSDYGRPRLPSRRPKHHVDPPAPETDSDYGRPRPSVERNLRNIDTSYYYRLINNYSGRRRALDVVNDGSNYALKMAPIGSYSGQFWYFVHLGNNVYNLRTQFLGNEFSLDIINDGANDKTHMAMTGDYSGQRWRFLPLDDGTFRLYNKFSGHRMYLDVASDTHVPRMFNNNIDYSGQHWSFERLGKM